jgi:hypothetical protein
MVILLSLQSSRLAGSYGFPPFLREHRIHLMLSITALSSLRIEPNRSASTSVLSENQGLKNSGALTDREARSHFVPIA